MNSTKKINLSANGLAFLICITGLIFVFQWQTGNFIGQFVYAFWFIGPLTVIQTFALWRALKSKRTNINWTIIIPVIIVILVLFSAYKFVKGNPV